MERTVEFLGLVELKTGCLADIGLRTTYRARTSISQAARPESALLARSKQSMNADP